MQRSLSSVFWRLLRFGWFSSVAAHIEVFSCSKRCLEPYSTPTPAVPSMLPCCRAPAGKIVPISASFLDSQLPCLSSCPQHSGLWSSCFRLIKATQPMPLPCDSHALSSSSSLHLCVTPLFPWADEATLQASARATPATCSRARHAPARPQVVCAPVLCRSCRPAYAVS